MCHEEREDEIHTHQKINRKYIENLLNEDEKNSTKSEMRI